MERTCLWNLLFSAALLCTSFWKASSLNIRLCEGYLGNSGHYHYGFYCPRLSDPSEHMYCCDEGNNSLKYCCSQMEFETLMTMNLSEVPTATVLRSPLPLLGVGCYGLLVFCLMIVDFLYFYKLNQHSFYNMLSQRCIGKQLISSVLHRNPKSHQGNKDLSGTHSCSPKDRTESTAQGAIDIKCEK